MTIEELAEKLGIELNDATRGFLTAYLNAQTAGLKQNNKDLLAERSALKSKLKVFEGVDPEEFTTLIAELDVEPADIVDRLRNAPKATGDAVKAAEAAAEAKYQRKIQQAEKKASDANAALELSNKARVDETLTRELTEEIVKRKGNVDLLLPAMKNRVKGEIDAETGKVTRKVFAPNGDEMLSDSGVPAVVGDLVESYRRDEKFGIAFEAEGGGSGSGKGGDRKPSGVGKNPYKKATWNLTEQNNLRASNPTLADQLKREAQLAG